LYHSTSTWKESIIGLKDVMPLGLAKEANKAKLELLQWEVGLVGRFIVYIIEKT